MARTKSAVQHTEGQMMTVAQVAKYLQMQESTIYSWAQQGKIPAHKIGRTWRFNKTRIDTWLSNRLQGANA